MLSKVLFRVDSATFMGVGHVMRCLTLAKQLRRQDFDCHFACREHDGAIVKTILQAGFDLSLFPLNSSIELDSYESWLGDSWLSDAVATRELCTKLKPNWLITDHYGIDAAWHKHLRSSVGQIMAIDDLANRDHDCDLLLDQTYGRKKEDYCKWVPKACAVLTGSHYALLRPEFATARSSSLAWRANKEKVEHILVSMGGTDPNNLTAKILNVLDSVDLHREIKLTVVLTSNAPHLASVQKMVAAMNIQTRVLVDVSDMAALLTKVDFAIGAAGSSSWERCCLGVPSLLTSLAENQEKILKNLINDGAAMRFPLSSSNSHTLNLVLDDLHLRQQMSTSAKNMCDGLGVTRIVEQLEKIA